ncbi:Ribonucleotide-diphosphate reductase (RNR), small subunit [Rhizina undulata]
MEKIHSEDYSLLIATYIKDPKRSTSYMSISLLAIRWIDLHSTSRCLCRGIILLWFLRLHLLVQETWTDGGSLLELICHDEGLHTDFACLLFSHPDVRPSQQMFVFHKQLFACLFDHQISEEVDQFLLFGIERFWRLALAAAISSTFRLGMMMTAQTETKKKDVWVKRKFSECSAEPLSR